MLLPLHGFVWRKELGYLLHKYDLWSRYEPEERGVLIAYASVYGNSGECRQHSGLPTVGAGCEGADVRYLRDAYLLHSVGGLPLQPSGVAATTYNAGVFITMEELLHDIAAHDLQNRRVVLLENGSWAPASGKGMQKILQPLKGWAADGGHLYHPFRPAGGSDHAAGAAGGHAGGGRTGCGPRRRRSRRGSTAMCARSAAMYTRGTPCRRIINAPCAAPVRSISSRSRKERFSP